MRASLVVNFDSPELHQLVHALDCSGDLSGFVYSYANKERAYEQVLSALTYAGLAHDVPLGRRPINDPLLKALTHVRGVLQDIATAVIGWAKLMSTHMRHRIATRLYISMQEKSRTKLGGILLVPLA